MVILLIPGLCDAQTTPGTVSGDDKYTLLEPLPCIDGVGGCASDKSQTDISLNDYIGYIYKFAIAVAAFLAVFMIIWGGFEYMLSDSITSKSDARNKFKNAATGLLMVLASYLILRTIDPRLVEINTSLPKIKVATTVTSDSLGTLSNEALNNLSIEDLRAIDEIDAKIKTFEEMREAARASGQTDQVALYDAKITSLMREKLAIQITRSNNSIQEFNKIIKNINSGVGSTDLALLNSTMDSAYNALTVARDYENASAIARQKNFYNEEIPKQKALIEEVNIYRSFSAAVNPGIKYAEKIKLQNLLEQYSKETIDPKYKNDSNIVQIYTSLKEDRINLLKNTLGITN